LVDPSAWTSEWGDAPRDRSILGLRLVSATERHEAIRLARERIGAGDSESPDAGEGFALALMRLYVWFGVCDPNDCNRTSELIRDPEHVFSRLTESWARRVFDAIQKLEVEKSAQFLEATDDDLVDLVERLGTGEIAELEPATQSTVLRHLRFALDALRSS
jgi:hypothetical protein